MDLIDGMEGFLFEELTQRNTDIMLTCRTVVPVLPLLPREKGAGGMR